MEHRLINKLLKLVDKYGYAYTATLIKERDTQSLKRWLKMDSIPAYKVSVINDYLKRGIR